MEILLTILKYIAQGVMLLANGILWILSMFDIFGIGKMLNGSSGKESVTKVATEDLPDNKDLPK